MFSEATIATEPKAMGAEFCQCGGPGIRLARQHDRLAEQGDRCQRLGFHVIGEPAQYQASRIELMR
jgi:hypothetical protein